MSLHTAAVIVLMAALLPLPFASADLAIGCQEMGTQACLRTESRGTMECEDDGWDYRSIQVLVITPTFAQAIYVTPFYCHGSDDGNAYFVDLLAVVWVDDEASETCKVYFYTGDAMPCPLQLPWIGPLPMLQ